MSDRSAAQKHGSEEGKGKGSKCPTGQGETNPLQSLAKVVGSRDIVEHATFNLKEIGEIFMTIVRHAELDNSSFGRMSPPAMSLHNPMQLK